MVSDIHSALNVYHGTMRCQSLIQTLTLLYNALLILMLLLSRQFFPEGHCVEIRVMYLSTFCRISRQGLNVLVCGCPRRSFAKHGL